MLMFDVHEREHGGFFFSLKSDGEEFLVLKQGMGHGRGDVI